MLSGDRLRPHRAGFARTGLRLENGTVPATRRGVIISNCQVQPLKHTLSLLCRDIRFEGFGVHVIRAEERAERIERFLESARREYEIVLSVPLSEAFGALALPRIRETFSGQFVATIPNFYFSGLHPDLTYLGDLGRRVSGPLTDYHSKIALCGYATDLSVDDCFAMYTDEVYRRLDYYGEFDRSSAELRRRDAELDVPFADELLKLLNKDLCFFSVNHPTSYLLGEYCAKLAGWLETSGLTTRTPWPWGASSLQNHLAHDAIFPIYPEIAAACGLDYEGSYTFKPATTGDNVVNCLDLRGFIEAEYRSLSALDRDELLRVPQLRAAVEAVGKHRDWPIRQNTAPEGGRMTLRVAPDIASVIARRCDRPLWEIDFEGILTDLWTPDSSAHRILTDLDRKYSIPEFIGTYLSALFLPNDPEDLVRFGTAIIDMCGAKRDVASLVGLTNYVFKRLTVHPLGIGNPAFFHRCAAVNFRLHAAANLAIHAMRAAQPEYYDFSREIDAFVRSIPEDQLAKRVCLVFLTANYCDNFDLWAEIFQASTAGRQQLVAIAVGPGVGSHVQGHLHKLGCSNAVVLEFLPSGPLTVCGNGNNLNFLWYLKVRLARHFVSTGHDLIYSDLDSFWLRDFTRIWEADPSNFDIGFMATGDLPIYASQKWGTTPCAGFFACRASKRTNDFLTAWERWVEIMFDDQIGLAQMLLEAGVRWEAQGDALASRRAVWDASRLSDLMDSELRFCIFSPELVKRVHQPDLSSAETAAVWHTRWIDSKEAHVRIGAPLIDLAKRNMSEPMAETTPGLTTLFNGPRAEAGSNPKPRMPARETLTTLADQLGSDKGSQVSAAPHHYTLLYDLLFGHLRDSPIDFLEIGLAVGGPELGHSADRFAISPSVRMWLSYFTQARIYGFDITDFSHMKDPRFTFVRGDSGRPDDLRRILAAARQFDVIIDDASHASYHQQCAFKELIAAVRPGGLYIIEDLHWQSPYFENSLPPVPKTWDFLKAYFVEHEYLDNPLLTEEFMCSIRSSIDCFSYFRDLSGLTNKVQVAILRKAH
jgi:SAM-dependent methyltransferase